MKINDEIDCILDTIESKRKVYSKMLQNIDDVSFNELWGAIKVTVGHSLMPFCVLLKSIEAHKSIFHDQ